MTKFNIISADSHVVEPPHTWTTYISPRFKDKAPHLVHEKDTDIFYCEGVKLIGIGTAGGAGKPPEQLRPQGRFEVDVPKGAWDPKARLADLAKDGVEAEVVYPTIAMGMYGLTDSGFQHACFQAYNTWLAQDFCAAYPNIFKGIGLISLDDIESAVMEARRCKELGLAGLMIALYPVDDRQYSSPQYDPFWAVAQELELPVSLHIATERGAKGIGTKKKTVGDVSVHASPVMRSIADIIFGGVFERFPNLKVVSAENDVGWASYFQERLDYIFKFRRPLHAMSLKGDVLPSQQFRRNVYMTFIWDTVGVKSRDLIGVNNILWSSDYPHGASMWPNSRQVIEDHMVGVSAADRRKIVAENAARLYGFN